MVENSVTPLGENAREGVIRLTASVQRMSILVLVFALSPIAISISIPSPNLSPR